tara:strand:+ start:2475 stop:2738 length:264 start_codon:yes stop_codon:yes gene_type:complete
MRNEGNSPWMQANHHTGDETVDSYNMRHIRECPGCSECIMILPQFYSSCGVCGEPGNISAMASHNEETGEYTCFSCQRKLEGKIKQA